MGGGEGQGVIVMKGKETKNTGWMAAAAALGWMATSASARADEPVANDRPHGTYVRVDAPDGLTGQAPAQHGGGTPHVLFLQRCAGGLTIYPGNGGSIDDESQIVGGVIEFPPFPYGDAAWNQVVDITTELFSPFNILVTDVDPGNAPHDEAVVCGDGAMAGFAGAGGVAPFSCGVIDNAITFTFAQTLGNDPQLIAEVIGQEAAHAWGLILACYFADQALRRRGPWWPLVIIWPLVAATSLHFLLFASGAVALLTQFGVRAMWWNGGRVPRQGDRDGGANPIAIIGIVFLALVGEGLIGRKAL